MPLPLPLSAILIILVDLGFEMFLALSYAMDAPESNGGLMKLSPRIPVTADSIVKLKKERLRQTEPWSVRKMIAGFSSGSDGEYLVDGNLLSYSYLEAGTIETIGCFICFFFVQWFHWNITPRDLVLHAEKWGMDSITLASGDILSASQQTDAFRAGNSAYFLAIMFQQAFNLFICKARMGLPIGWSMVQNMFNFYGLLGGVAFGMFIVYVQPINVAFGTYYMTTPYVWLIAMSCGLFLFLYSIVRTFVLRACNLILIQITPSNIPSKFKDSTCTLPDGQLDDRRAKK